MSDSSYADEFGKWLQNNPTQVEDSSDSSDNSRDYAMNTEDTLESESEKLQKDLPFERCNKLSSGSISDQAPILVDDDDYDDDLFTNKKEQYEDEPPVLEPVPNEIQSCKVSDAQNPQLSPPICIRSYSRSKLHSRKNLQKAHKMNNKDKGNFISPDLCDESRHIHSLKSKDSKSGNIFDKFIESYDFPPPLIPSPEALQVCSEPSNILAKNPSHSPNFCAMEADSTSEINRDKLGTVLLPHRSSKNFAHDVSVECDSTCMLAASPFIVSPASVSNGDMEEPIDSGDGVCRDEDLEHIGYASKICDNAPEKEVESEDQSTLMHTAIKNCLDEEIVHREGQGDKYYSKSSTDQQMLGVSTFSSNNYGSLSVDVDSNVPEYFAGPPVLSAVSPPSIRSHRYRKEQHTADSPKVCSRSRKRSYCKPPEQADIACSASDASSPPILNRVSETAVTTLRGRRSRVVSEHAQTGCLNCNKDIKTISHRSRRRCNSMPVAGEANYCLSENLHSFITGTSELSGLQTHMHTLLYRLFPQLKTELDAMSPESFKFEDLLSDLVKLLEQPDGQDSSTPQPPPLISSKDLKPAYINEHQRLTSEFDCTFKNTNKESSSPLLSASDSQAAAADYAKIVLHSDAISCNRTSSSKLPSSYPHSSQSKQQQQVKAHQSDEKNLVAPLSRLSVQDMEDILTPSEVLLCKDPGASLKSFVKLSCRALQLLLPDLTVSVYNELGQSPSELVAFINSVILINSKRRKKY